MRDFLHFRNLFSDLYTGAKDADERSTHEHQGHGLDHNVAVAMKGVQLAGDDEHLAEMAFIAGLLHSTDHVVGEEDVEAVKRELDRLLYDYLPDGYFTKHGLEVIKDAVLRHKEYKDRNLATRSRVQQILMDADKLINMNPGGVGRSGQYHNTTPAIEYQYIGKGRNPDSTYDKPSDLLNNLRGFIEWTEPGWFHTEAGQREADESAAWLVDYIMRVEQYYIDLGLAGIKL